MKAPIAHTTGAFMLPQPRKPALTIRLGAEDSALNGCVPVRRAAVTRPLTVLCAPQTTPSAVYACPSHVHPPFRDIVTTGPASVRYLLRRTRGADSRWSAGAGWTG
jgi:hypothetical protein